MKHLFTWIFLIMLYPAHSQSVVWVKQFKGDAYCSVKSSCTDNKGNLYVAGYFQNGTLLLSPHDSIICTGVADYFVAKFGNLGDLLWYRHIPGPSQSMLYYFDINICCDRNGNPSVSGHFEETITIGNNSVTSQGLSDAFIASFTPDGTLKWLRRAGGGGDDYSSGITCDEENNICIIGYFCYTANIGGSSYTSNGEWDIYVSKIDTNGTFLWTKVFYSAGNDQSAAIRSDHKGAYLISGVYGWSCQLNICTPFHLDSITLNASSYSTYGTPDQKESFLAKISIHDGSPVWAKNFTGNYEDAIEDISVDDEGNIDVSGRFESLMQVTGGGYCNSAGQTDIFWASFHSDGSLLQLHSGGGANYDLSSSIISLSPDKKLLLATLSGSGYFYGNPMQSSNGSLIGMVMSGQHNLISMWQAPGYNPGLSHDGYNGVYMTADFKGNKTFGGVSLQSGASQKSYIAYFSNVQSIHQQTRPDPAEILSWYNPMSRSIQIESSEIRKQMSCTLYTMSGSMIHQEVFSNTSKADIPVHHLSEGIYMLRITSDENHVLSTKLMIH